MGGGSGLKKYRGLLLAALFLPALLLGCGGGTSGAGSAASSGQAEASVTEEPKKNILRGDASTRPGRGESGSDCCGNRRRRRRFRPRNRCRPGRRPNLPKCRKRVLPAMDGWLPLTRAIRAVEIPSRSRWARGLRRRRQKSVPERMGRHQA